MRITRRRLLQAGGAAAGIAAGVLGNSVRALAAAGVPPGSAQALQAHVGSELPRVADPSAPALARAKRLSLMNLHTGESLELDYYQDGDYMPHALAAIDALLRDFRTGERHVIDPNLLDLIHDVALCARVDPVFSVISGYRSPQTNERLRERTGGVSRHSLHMEGRAIDVRLAGVDCVNLSAQARALCRGGVGYYRQSDFVHLDTGACRTWNG